MISNRISHSCLPMHFFNEQLSNNCNIQILLDIFKENYNRFIFQCQCLEIYIFCNHLNVLGKILGVNLKVGQQIYNFSKSF